MNLKTARTYIYIDVSNIKYACKWSCGFEIDFIKLYNYLKKKYPNAQEIRYYEGIAPDDYRRKKHFDFLSKKVGYVVCPLWRKSYDMPARYETFKCEKCGALNTVKTLNGIKKMKSNVDMYLASDMLERMAKTKEPLHIIILSCDGDYAEAIKSVIRISPNSQVTVIATPMKKKNNCLSARLSHLNRELRRENFRLVSIEGIKGYIRKE